MRLRDMGAEAVLLGGGGRAILLQLAHPSVGHAVAEHSTFGTDPTRRLRHTLAYVYALFWGTPAQAQFVTAMVEKAHAPVHSTAYDANDPVLQLWVNATLYDSAVMVHERVFGPLSTADADAIYDDYAEIGVALRMPRALWPADRAAFQRYWDASVTLLAVDEVTRGVARTLHHPPVAPLWLRASMPLARFLTAGLLPPGLRAAYGLKWNEKRQHRFDRMMLATALVYPHLPRALRHWPKNHLLGKIPG